MGSARRGRNSEPLSAAIAVRLPASLVERIDGASERYGVSRSEIIRDALDSWVQRQAIKELAAAQSGTWTSGAATITTTIPNGGSWSYTT